MDKNDFTASGKNHVWMAGYAPDVQTVAEPHSVNKASDGEFWLCVL
jgi:hypothetical protein